MSTALLLAARATSALLALLGLNVNTQALISLPTYLQLFGFSHSPSSSSSTPNPFIPISGGRALSSSLAILGCAALGLDRAVGVLLIAGSVAAGIDGYVLRQHVGAGSKEEREEAEKKAYGHWSMGFLCVGMGAWMVRNGA
ncbi:hypothetical protein K402DRAFT_397867 [Aulographum hederae CBS 113979]|uniref:DUF4267 domain-containing protein n=1 Tax=Aulographum hederae CBS 113979 TaxID=1176131 RepID=A0A6G1GMH7_9PEZI|nr:hypothetical protein K402DRAFT_397867 [Aulographum hederae CBS 113979]